MRGPEKSPVGRVTDHGGDLAAARALFPEAPSPMVDLSTGISPHSYPHYELSATALARLPAREALEDLLAAASKAYRAPGPLSIVAAPGTQILLPAVMGLVPPGRARILGPTYAEHARAAALIGHAVETVTSVDDLSDADLAVVVNPNNPDGRLVPRRTLRDLAAHQDRRNGLLVVDEAFMDVGPADASLAPEADVPGLVVLRSFGKFFGLAGVRLGFALSSPAVARRLTDLFGPWAVSGPAIEIGTRALRDTEWQKTMRDRLGQDAARLDLMLRAAGLQIAGGTSLFRFVRTPEAAGLFTHLGRSGILVRRFAWTGEAVRVGLPHGEDDWKRLDAVLALWARGRRTGPDATEEAAA